MRTIFKVPLLKQGSRGPAVEDLQSLLNAFQENGIWTKTKLLEVDGKFGPLTEGKVRDFQKSAGLSANGIAGSQTNAVLFAPQADRVDQAQGIATNWTFLARAAVQTLRSYVLSLQFNHPPPAGNLPVLVEALRIHFHIALPRPRQPAPRTFPPRGGDGVNPLDLLLADEQLSFVNQVYEDTLFVLDKASIREGRVFYSMGVRQSKDRGLFGFSGGVRGFPKGTINSILVAIPATFHLTTGDSFRTTSQQASTVLHEVCHYVRPPSEGASHVDDFAYGIPAFQGKPAKDKGVHNYQQLTSDEAVHNAESYNLFAEHVTFGRDTRFGRLSTDLDAFECGSKNMTKC